MTEHSAQDRGAERLRELVSVVMVVKNEATHLSRSLPLLADQEIDLPLELVVVDSGSTDSTLEVVRSWQRSLSLRLQEIPPDSFHHARTRNLGASFATGRYLVFLGGDAVPLGGTWLRELLAPLRSGNERVAASYGKQLPRDDADLPNRLRMEFNYGNEPMLKRTGAGLSSKELYFFSSVNCAIDRERTGSEPPFAEHLPVGEDITLSRRLLEEGWSIAYVPSAAVVHSHNYSALGALRRGFDSAVVYERLGLFSAGDRSIRSDGLRYLRTSLRRAICGGPISLLRFGAFFVCWAAGVQLGRRHRILPEFLRRSLSKYGVTA